jgi:hypothetical protein
LTKRLDLLIESAAEQACRREGEISEELQAALAECVKVFGEKVDRIANYFKSQEALAETAKKEACRLPWPRWEELLAYIPEGTLLDQLRRQASHASLKGQRRAEGGTGCPRCEIVSWASHQAALNAVGDEDRVAQRPCAMYTVN